MRVGGLAKRKVGVVRVCQHGVGDEHHASWVFVADGVVERLSVSVTDEVWRFSMSIVSMLTTA